MAIKIPSPCLKLISNTVIKGSIGRTLHKVSVHLNLSSTFVFVLSKYMIKYVRMENHIIETKHEEDIITYFKGCVVILNSWIRESPVIRGGGHFLPFETNGFMGDPNQVFREGFVKNEFERPFSSSVSQIFDWRVQRKREIVMFEKVVSVHLGTEVKTSVHPVLKTKI